MENQHSKNIILIIFCVMLMYACHESPQKEAIPEKVNKVNQMAKVDSSSSSSSSSSSKRVEHEQTTDTLKVAKLEKNKQEATEPNTDKPVKKKEKRKKTYPKMEFELETYDFGEITEGDTIHCKFKFTNTGKRTLNIKSASATCGCTQPSYPFLGVEPGEEGNISVRYISVGKSGPQEATITVKSNADMPTKTLLLKGIVKDRKTNQEIKKDSTAIGKEK